jgi:hypothetical protein
MNLHFERKKFGQILSTVYGQNLTRKLCPKFYLTVREKINANNLALMAP